MGLWNLFANSWNRGARKPLNRKTNKSKRRPLGLESLEDRTNPTSFLSFVDPNPSAGNGFGTTILSLGSGKVAVTAPFDDAGGTNAGAVYLYNGSTGALISTIRGSHANDNLGSGGLFAVGTSSTGNFLIASPNWDNGSVANAGALTFVSGSPASSITVDSTNSLVGSTDSDAVGTAANVKILTNNNYVVATPLWNGTAADVGAVTWGSGSTGVVGAISNTNSYIGTTASDQIGSGGVIALSNGNYAFASPNFDTSVVNAGAATWGNGSSGSTGTVSTSNSWVGALANDNVGSGGLTALTGNGNFVISSPNWDSTDANVGAVTGVNGTSGTSGVIGTGNSFVGTTTGDQVGSGGVYALTNGNYVISSPSAGNFNGGGSVLSAGAATWSSGVSGSFLTGSLDATNSLQGSTDNEQVGSGGVTVLNNGAFVVKSPLWSGGKGAATWSGGIVSTRVVGTVSSSNSLVGSTAGDAVGTSVVALAGANGNYVVVTTGWDNGLTANVGAVTWGSRTAGVSGTISASNSIVGSTAFDAVGSAGVTALSNGNYVVASPFWDNSATSTANVGAVTWGSGTASTGATVSTSNSWVGSTAIDEVGLGGVTALTDSGNFVIVSPLWDNSGTANVGATTRLTGDAASNGTISTSNSLYGDSADDRVGSGGVTALANGNYLVSSPIWNNGAITDAGAVTSLRGSAASSGTVSANYSIKGTTANLTSLGTPSIDTVNNNFYTRFNVNVSGQAGGTILAGSINPTPPAITSGSSTTITYGDVLSFTVTATGDPGVGSTVPGAIVFTSTGLPSGISLNSATGVMSGTSGSTPAGTYNFTITASNKVGSDATQSFTLTINQKTLTITGTTAANKVYDNTNTATPNTSSSALSGVVGSDAVTLNTGSVTGTFAQITVGDNITVTFAGFTISGAAAGNYSLTQPTTTANITQATLTITGLTGNNKTYDGSTTATASGTATLSGVIAGTSVTLAGTPTYTFASANVGTGISISTTGYTIDNANYTLTQPTLSANITTATLTVTGTTAANKVYDNTNTATPNTASSALSGVIGSDVVTLNTGSVTGTFAQITVGDNITVTFAGFTISGAAAGNYSLTQPTTTANITQATLTITGLTGNNKTYDGSTTATASGTATLSGVIAGTSVTLAGTPTYTFASANVGTGISISTTGYTIDNANYTLTQPTLSANITTATLTVTGLTGNNKTYTSTTAATASGTATLSGVIGSDTVTIGGTPTYTFASANVGTGISISTTGFTISGASSGNYTLTQPTLSANITQATLSATVSGTTTKVYTGTTAATILTTNISFVGLMGSQNFTFNNATLAGTYNNANVASASSVSGSIASSDVTGTNGGLTSNYAFPATVTGSGTISAAPLVITPVNTVRPYGATNPTFTATYSGLVDGETSSVVSGLVLTSAAGIASAVGNYAISGSGASAANYSISYVEGVLTVSGPVALTDPNPSSGDGFGTVTQYLTNGNVVVTAPYDDAGGTNAGAVYLFNSTTGALISTLKGSNNNDQVGIGGVSLLSNGNFVVISSNWNGGKGAITFVNASTGLTASVDATNSLLGVTTSDHLGLYPVLALKNGNYVVRNPSTNGGRGSVTWGSGTTGAVGTISESNSLVGSSATDAVGSLAITELTNGNFAARSPQWNGSMGAVTWGSGSVATVGVVGSANSLVGSTANDQVGSAALTTLANGNFVVASPNWDNGDVNSAGAVTWINGLNGKTREGAYGAVSGTNSLVGSTTGDMVGYGGVTKLITNNNFVVASPNWGGIRGAVTWGSGTGATYGAVGSGNSLVGNVGSTDNVGSGSAPVTALGNGNYVVTSQNWGSNKGAVTLGIGLSGTSGIVDSSTSLVGAVTGSYVGSSGITELSNNNFVVKSSSWSDGTNASAGAATFASGSVAATGTITSSNSLVGSNANDHVGSKVTTLKNNNYVVLSSDWDGTKGAVTWGSGTTGISGVVSSTNSLVGSTANDQIGSGGVTVLSNNNFVVSSPNWSNGGQTAAGAATFGFAGIATTGVVGAGNSLVGTHTNDKVGSGGVTVLGAGAYIVSSPLWNSDSASKVGAVTWNAGAGILAASVASSNSLVGSAANDQVGSGGITVLSNGNYVVASPLFDNGVTDAGAVTWASGTAGRSGSVSSSNSLVGTHANDKVGSGGVTALKTNGNYVVATPLWNGTLGAVTWGSGSEGLSGSLTSSNSLVGSTVGDSVGSGGVTALAGGNYLVRSASWTNNGLANAGALTWGSGGSGISGSVAATNSMVGVSANAGLSTVSENTTTSTYFVTFLTETNGARVSVGYQTPTSPAFTSANNATFTVGNAGSFTFTASGNPASVFTLNSGSLPTGLTLNSLTGVLSGTPATGSQGTYNLTIRASNSWSGGYADQSFTLTVN